MTAGILQTNDEPSGNSDRFSARNFVWWVGYLSLCLALWEANKAILSIILISVLFLPPLIIAWLAGAVRTATRRRSRSTISALLGAPLAVALLLGLSALGLDPDRIHFLLVKYPHELELRSSAQGANTKHSWSWGLDAAPLSAGVAYTLKYDPTDGELFTARSPDKSVRSMGDHFYLVKESEDGSAL